MQKIKKPKDIIGKTTKTLEMNGAKNALIFNFEDGSYFNIFVEGDCCSSSWIETLTGVHDLIGYEITEADLPVYKQSYKDEDGDYYVISYYSVKIKTTQGFFEIEFRNESNGYYGAFLSFGSPQYSFTGDRDFRVIIEDFGV